MVSIYVLYRFNRLCGPFLTRLKTECYICSMTIWTPNLTAGEGRPLYLAIADAIAEGINAGELKPGDRMPTHRDLAQRLGVTVGTVSRAYLEAERRGHVTGEVGRGTFVRRREGDLVQFASAPEQDGQLVDLRSNLPAWPESEDPGAMLSQTLAAIARMPGLAVLHGSETVAEPPAHREAGAAWLERCGLQVPASQVLPVSGAQHGIMAVLASATQPGDVIATMSLTNPGLKAVAALLHCQLEPLAFDDSGILPEAFAQACQSRSVKLLYLNPTLQNPTATTMSLERRQQIVDIARRFGVAILEDDEYGPLWADRPQPIAALAPELTYYVASLSKTLGFGLRYAYVAPPARQVTRVLNSIRASIWMAPPLVGEIAATWIRSGTAEHLLHQRRQEAAARYELASTLLSGYYFSGSPSGYHLWLPLPEEWRAERFAAEAERRHVVVASSEEFIVGREAPVHGIRIGLGSASSRQGVRRGLQTIVDLLREGPPVSVV